MHKLLRALLILAASLLLPTLYTTTAQDDTDTCTVEVLTAQQSDGRMTDLSPDGTRLFWQSWTDVETYVTNLENDISTNMTRAVQASGLYNPDADGFLMLPPRYSNDSEYLYYPTELNVIFAQHRDRATDVIRLDTPPDTTICRTVLIRETGALVAMFCRGNDVVNLILYNPALDFAPQSITLPDGYRITSDSVRFGANHGGRWLYTFVLNANAQHATLLTDVATGETRLLFDGLPPDFDRMIAVVSGNDVPAAQTGIFLQGSTPDRDASVLFWVPHEGDARQLGPAVSVSASVASAYVVPDDTGTVSSVLWYWDDPVNTLFRQDVTDPVSDPQPIQLDIQPDCLFAEAGVGRCAFLLNNDAIGVQVIAYAPGSDRTQPPSVWTVPFAPAALPFQVMPFTSGWYFVDVMEGVSVTEGANMLTVERWNAGREPQVLAEIPYVGENVTVRRAGDVLVVAVLLSDAGAAQVWRIPVDGEAAPQIFDADIGWTFNTVGVSDDGSVITYAVEQAPSTYAPAVVQCR